MTAVIDVRRVVPNTTVNVWGTVSGAEHIVMRTGTLAPDEVNLTFVHDYHLMQWRFQIYIIGTRILRDGRRGKSTLTTAFYEGDITEAPEWVRDFVARHTPPPLPRIEEVG